MNKGEMINEILGAVNAQAERTKGSIHQTLKADGRLFFSLAFLTEIELKKICKKIGIK